MPMLFLLIAMAGGNPAANLYSTEQAACVAFLASPNSHLYQITGKSNAPKLEEVECVPLQTIQIKSK